MSIDQIPTTRLVAMGIQSDMARINHQLDALRALAHRELPDMKPVYEGDADLKAGPWDTKACIISELGAGMARMDILRGAHGVRMIPEPMRQQAEFLYHEIDYQTNELMKAGYLSKEETAKSIAKEHHDTSARTMDAIRFYTRIAYHSPENRIHTGEAQTSFLDDTYRGRT